MTHLYQLTQFSRRSDQRSKSDNYRDMLLAPQ
jgi:hypothetical protein